MALSKRTFSGRATGVLLAITIVAGLAGAAGYLAHSANFATDGTLVAAWVQAVGSIGAIVGAYWLSNREVNFQRQLERERSDAADRDLCEGSLRLVSFSARHIHELLRLVLTKPSVDTLRAQAAHLHAAGLAISRFPAHQLPDHNAMMMLVQTGGLLDGVDVHVQRLFRSLEAGEEGDEPWQALALKLAYFAKLGMQMEINMFNSLCAILPGGIEHPSPKWLQGAREVVKDEEMNMNGRGIDGEKAARDLFGLGPDEPRTH